MFKKFFLIVSVSITISALIYSAAFGDEAYEPGFPYVGTAGNMILAKYGLGQPPFLDEDGGYMFTGSSQNWINICPEVWVYSREYHDQNNQDQLYYPDSIHFWYEVISNDGTSVQETGDCECSFYGQGLSNYMSYDPYQSIQCDLGAVDSLRVSYGVSENMEDVYQQPPYNFSPYSPLDTSFTVYVLPNDGNLDSPDPCSENPCTTCSMDGSPEPPKMSTRSLGASIRNPDLSMLPNRGREVIREIRASEKEIVLYRNGRGTIWKIGFTLPQGENDYPRGWICSLNGGGGTLIRIQKTKYGGITYRLTRPDRSIAVFAIKKVPGPDMFCTNASPVAGTCVEPGFQPNSGASAPEYQYDSQGRVTQYTESGQTWTYDYEFSSNQSNPEPPNDPPGANPKTKQTKCTFPDGSYAIITYYRPFNTGAGAGYHAYSVSKISCYSPADVWMSSTSYLYDSKGRITWAKKGDKEVTYVYDDLDNTALVTQTQAGIQTVYHYGRSSETGDGQPAADETWVIRKGVLGSSTAYVQANGDQLLKYKYNIVNDSGFTTSRRAELTEVTDPEGNVTKYNYDGYHRLSDTTDPMGLMAKYIYDDPNTDTGGKPGAITSVKIVKESDREAVICQSEYTYYTDCNGKPSTWLKTAKDPRGNWIYLQRDNILNAPGQVSAVKVSQASVPDWNTISPIRTFEYYGTLQDITAAATVTGDSGQGYPQNLKDEQVGPSHEDEGNWDYTETYGNQVPYSNSYTYANASYWSFSETKKLSRISLYFDPDYPGALNDPMAIKIFAKDGTETDPSQYNQLVYATDSDSTESWSTESYAGHSAKVLHLSVNVSTTDLKIVYGAGAQTHLGEVRLFSLAESGTDGKPGQLKKVIIPDIDGNEDAWVEFKYGQNGKILEHPTQISYPYFNPATSLYETKTCSIEYDNAGRVVQATDAKNRIVNLAYEFVQDMEDGNPVAHRQGTLTYTADAKQQLHMSCCGADWFKDEENRKVNLKYDESGRPVSAWVDGTGQTDTNPLIENQFDVFGNVSEVKTHTSESDTDGRVSTYTYDGNRNPVSLSYPNNKIGQEEVKYDAVGNPLWTKDGKGRYTLYHYNDLHQLEAIGYTTTRPPDNYAGYDGSSPAISIDYYSNSGLAHTITKGSELTHFTYDELGRVLTYTPSGHAAITYTYNNLDQVTSITSGGYNVQYNYYANGLLKNVTTDNGGTELAKYTYDEVGALQNIQYGNHDSNGNHVNANIGYGSDDPRYPLTSISYTLGSTTLGSFGYTLRDKSLNTKTVTDSTFNGSANFTYDAMGRLESASYPGPAPDQPMGGAYVYDWVGNRTSPPAIPNPMVYNEVDQLVYWPGMHGNATNPGYIYDTNGNLTEVRDLNGANAVVTYEYDPDSNLLTSATYNGRTLTNTWDALGNRSSVSVNGSTCAFTYNILAGVPAVIEEVKDGTRTYYYYRDPSGALIARRLASDSDSWQYYHYDEQGSTRLITDSNGNVTDTYTYDAYGNTIAHNGPTNDNPYQYVGSLGYYTHYQDPDFGLIQLGFRFYDPEVGRFTQKDPARAGINYYTYTGIDPWGLSPCPDSGGSGEGFFEGAWNGFLKWFGGKKGDGWDRFIQGGSDFSAGMGDTISMGQTNRLRRAIGVDQYVNYGSGWHTAGRVTGYAWWAANLYAISSSIAARLASGACFPSGTQVATITGKKTIERIRTGDIVWSYDTNYLSENDYPDAQDTVDILGPDMSIVAKAKLHDVQTGVWLCFHGKVFKLIENHTLIYTGVVAAHVVRTFIKSANALVDLTVSTANGRQYVISGTSNHPFYVPALHTYVGMGKLACGTILQTADGSLVTVICSSGRTGDFVVYNFEVERQHNYYVSEGMLLVHNDCTSLALEMQEELGEGTIHRVESTVQDTWLSPEGARTPSPWAYHDVLIRDGQVYDPLMPGTDGQPWIPLEEWLARWPELYHVITPPISQ